MMRSRTPFPTSHGSRLSVLRACTIVLTMMLAVSCARLPPLETIDVSAGIGRTAECSAVFPADRWRLIHAIEPVIADNSTGVFIGVTVVSPAEREVEAVIMTLEGLVMFHARSSGDHVDTLRAISPFDSPHFAKGLIEDVRLLFFEPVAVKTMLGWSANGTFTCRYFRSDASAVDVMPAPDGSWMLLEYDRRSKLRRRVSADAQGDCPASPGARQPCRINLQAFQHPGYTLKMSLIETERDSGKNQ